MVDLPAPLGPRKPWISPAPREVEPVEGTVRPKSCAGRGPDRRCSSYHGTQDSDLLNDCKVVACDRRDRTRRQDRSDGRGRAYVERLGTPSPRPVCRGCLARLRAPARRRRRSDDGGRAQRGLEVSAAAVSGAVRYLTQVHIIGKERERGSRRDVYVVADDAWHDAMMSRDRCSAQLERGGAGLDAVGGGAQRRRPPPAAVASSSSTSSPSEMARSARVGDPSREPDWHPAALRREAAPPDDRAQRASDAHVRSATCGCRHAA